MALNGFPGLQLVRKAEGFQFLSWPLVQRAGALSRVGGKRHVRRHGGQASDGWDAENRGGLKRGHIPDSFAQVWIRCFDPYQVRPAGWRSGPVFGARPQQASDVTCSS